MSETKALHVFTDGCEWWVGESVESVLRQQREDCGLAEEDQDPEDWGQAGDDTPLTIAVDADGHITDSDVSVPVTLTCAEWAAREGGGLLCTEDY